MYVTHNLPLAYLGGLAPGLPFGGLIFNVEKIMLNFEHFENVPLKCTPGPSLFIFLNTPLLFTTTNLCLVQNSTNVVEPRFVINEKKVVISYMC